MKSSRYQPYANRSRITNFDCHCQACGVLIKGAAHQKPISCFKCKAPQGGRQGWMEGGWGRCAECDSWMNNDHCYCMCGFANQEAIERRRMQHEAARQQEEHRRQMEVRELQKSLAQAERHKMQLQQKLDEREADDAVAAMGDVELDDK